MAEQLRLIYICGSSGSGKDTQGDRLGRDGFWHISAGGVLRRAAQDRGYPDLTREDLERVAAELYAQLGDGPITRYAINLYASQKAAYPNGLVLSGIRRVHEIQVGRALAVNCVVIFLNADRKLRFERIVARHRGDDINFETFSKRDIIESEGKTTEGQAGIWLDGVRASSDYILDASGTVDQVYAKLKNTLGLE